MNNKPQTKKQWQAPQIFDLDVKGTMAGVNPDPTNETQSTIYYSYYPTNS
jgi:hypothetical protein